MPRVMPIPGEDEQAERLVKEAFQATRVSRPLEPRYISLNQLREFGQWLLHQQRFSPKPRRVFIVVCSKCPEFYVITAGPRGGGWKGACPTCRHKAGSVPKAEVVEEIEDE